VYQPTSTLVGAVGYQRSNGATAFQGANECQVCGASPAADVKFSSLRGLIVIFIARTHRGRWCRDCGEAQYRNAQAFTMTWGWWGVFTLFLTPIAMLLNLRERQKVRGLGVPHNRRAASLDAGPPVTQRPGFYIACVLLLLILVPSIAGS
jgi:hypothetical protein